MGNEEVKLDDINLSSQMVGEVQAFIFTMRWVLYEFYSFKKMKKEGIVNSGDFDQLEDDIIYVLHKAVVKNQVLETLVILNRLIN